MRKYILDNKLQPMAPGDQSLSYRAAAFSLVELVVSLGVLVVMFALAGQVFNFTIQSTGQATALVEVNQQLRALEQTLREDLAFVESGQSLILIQGNPVNAYWTQDSKDADDDSNPANGYPRLSDAEREYVLSGNAAPAPPRADMLMFFTSHKSNSYTDSAVSANLQQVVYGHAELGEYEASSQGSSGTTTFTFKGIVDAQAGQSDQPLFPLDTTMYPSPTKVCLVPASKWHLARRSVLIAPTYSPRVNPPGIDIINTPVGRLDDDELLLGATDIISRLAIPGSGNPPALIEFDYERDVLWPATTNDYSLAEAPVFLAWQLPRIFAAGQNPYARSRLDVTPPPAFANRLGHYLLPNCASFKVEWTLDPKSSFVAGRLNGMTEVLWFDPGFVKNGNQFKPNPGAGQDDPLQPMVDAIARARQDGNKDLERRLESLLERNANTTGQNIHIDGTDYALADRFRSTAWDPSNWPEIGTDSRPNTVAFVASRIRQTSATDSEYVSDDVFPSALRVTVDVFDREGRLDRPVRHVMVIPVGR